jgi:hypothetical protein
MWTFNTRKRSHPIVLVVVVIGLCFAGVYIFEPKDPPTYEDVKVTSCRRGKRGRQTFTVVSVTSGKSWEVSASRSKFDSDYRGPAVLVIQHGRWTGMDHLTLTLYRPATSPSTKRGQSPPLKVAQINCLPCLRPADASPAG